VTCYDQTPDTRIEASSPAPSLMAPPSGLARNLGIQAPVTFLQRIPIVRRLYARGLLLLVLVGLAVVAVLVEGALNHEPPAEPDAVAEMGSPVPASAGGFRPTLEKTPLTYESDYWRQLGERAARNLVLIGDERTPGVLVAPGLALTSIRAADDVARRARERQAEAEQLAMARGGAVGDVVPPAEAAPGEAGFPAVPQLVAVDVEQQVALFAVAEVAPSSFTPVDAVSLHAGAFVAAVTLGPNGDLRITPGHLVSTSPAASGTGAPFELSFNLPASPRVAAIIDLDDNLLGIAFDTDHGTHILGSREALTLAARLHGGHACQALQVSDVDEVALRLLDISNGVLVERVVAGAFAGEPPIRAGDLLLQWQGRTVESASDFSTQYGALEPGTSVTFEVLRGRRRVAATLRMPLADCRPATEPLVQLQALGATFEWHEPLDSADARGWRVVAVRSGGPAAAASLEPFDLVTAVNGVPLSAATARAPFDRFEQRLQPLLLTVRRNGLVKLLPVTPPDD
jgi:hypothetical protein